MEHSNVITQVEQLVTEMLKCLELLNLRLREMEDRLHVGHGFLSKV